ALGKEVGEIDSAALNDPHQLFELREQLGDTEQLRSDQRALVLTGVAIADEELRAFQAEVRVDLLHRMIVQHILDLLLSRDLIERRLGDVNSAGLDQLLHVAEEKRQKQSPDMRSVDVGICHNDDLAVAALFEIEILPKAAAQRADD